MRWSIYAASGPYTIDAALDFGPWRKLLAKLKVDKPTVTFLVKPIVSRLVSVMFAHTLYKPSRVHLLTVHIL